MSKLDPPLWNIAVTLHKSLKTIGTKQLEAKLSKRIGEIFMIRGSQVEKKQDIQAKIDKIEERLILGKISEAKAEELEKSLYDEIKIIDDRATELNNEIGELGRRLDHIKKTGDTTLDYDNLNEDDRFNVTHEVFEKILVRRTSRFTLELKIYNKINDKVETIEIKTYASVRKKD